MTNNPQWLTWAQRVQAIAQSGKHYTENPYDYERYEQLEALAAEIMAAHLPDVSATTWVEVFQSEHGYGTPKVDTRGVVLNAAGEILMVREKRDNGRWTLPGGWADIGETPSEACVKEVLEEGGYGVRVERLLAVYDRRFHGHPPHVFHIYKLFFHCVLLDEKPVPSPQGDLEVSEVRWFKPDALPPADEWSLGRVTPQQMQRFFEILRTNAPTDFD